jgi:hypothetical protein
VTLDPGSAAIGLQVAAQGIGLLLTVAIAGLLRRSGIGDAAKAARGLVKRFIVMNPHLRFTS